MILRGNENPYLRGKAPKRYVSEPSLTSWNPFSHLTEVDRAKAIEQIGQHHTESFNRNLQRLQKLGRSCNFFQLLSHFAYYDQLFLDPDEKEGLYLPAPQSSVELLQALILQISEDELRLQLDTPPEPQVLTE